MFLIVNLYFKAFFKLDQNAKLRNMAFSVSFFFFFFYYSKESKQINIFICHLYIFSIAKNKWDKEMVENQTKEIANRKEKN